MPDHVSIQILCDCIVFIHFFTNYTQVDAENVMSQRTYCIWIVGCNGKQ